MAVGNELVPFLIATYSVIQTGIILSGIGVVSHSITAWLSRHIQIIDEPDPTAYKRQFEIFFETVFEPVGWTAANRVRSRPIRQISFELSIGVVVIISAVAIYLVTAGMLTGAMLAAHQTIGITINPVPLFRQTVAGILVCALAVMFHAGERAQQI